MSISFVKLGGNRWLYEYGIKEIERAYRASRSSLENDRASISKEYDDYKNTLGADWEEDPFTDKLIENHEEAEAGLGLVREAFATTLHHFWEKQCKGWLKVENYYSGQAYKALKKQGYSVEKTGLEKLRKTVNCIKHNSPVLFKSDPKMFKASVKSELAQGIKPDYHDDLLLKDEHIEEFIETLKKSGPPPK